MTTLARRDLPVVIAAKATSLLGDEIASVTLLLKLQSSGASAATVAVLLIAAMAPLVLLAPMVGRCVDRFDSRVLLLTSGLLQTALCAVLAFQSRTGAILALVLALGIGEAFNGTVWQSLLPAIAGPDGLPKALSRSQAATTIAMIAGSPLAGLLSGHLGSRAPLLIDAVTYLAVAGAALLVRTRHGSAPRDDTRGGVRIITGDPLLRVLVGMLGLFVLLGSMVNVVIVFLVRDTLHGSDTWFGIVLGGLGVGMVVGALTAGRLTGPDRLARALVLAAFGLAASLVTMGAAGHLIVLLIIGVGLGLTNGLLNVTLSSLTMSRVAGPVRGRVAATVTAVASGGQIVAYLLGGALATVLSPREIVLLAGSLALLAPLLFGRRVIRNARLAPESTERPATVVGR